MGDLRRPDASGGYSGGAVASVLVARGPDRVGPPRDVRSTLFRSQLSRAYPSGEHHVEIILLRQKNLWATSGSGNLASA
jgi:hypothetical protein